MTIIFSNHLDEDCKTIKKMWANWDSPFKLIEVRPKDEYADLRVTNALIEEDDTLILIGHGTSHGLLHPNFNSGEYLIHEENINLIHAKRVICIWCYASTFCDNHNLKAFATSMFISNVDEAWDNGIRGVTQDEINIIDERIDADIARLILSDIPMKDWIMHLGAKMDIENPIDMFNRQGFYYNE